MFVQGFRIFFWEFIDHEDTKASLLSYIINTLGETLKLPSTLVESRVAVGLYLLLGPAPASHDLTLTIFQQNIINRLEGNHNMFMMQEHVPTNYEEAKRMFSDLGKGLRLLLRGSSISSNTVVSSMLTMFEDYYWDIDNQAACLLFSCETVVKLFLSDLPRRRDQEDVPLACSHGHCLRKV